MVTRIFFVWFKCLQKYSECSVFYNIKMVRGLIVLIDILFVVLGFPLERGNDDGEKLSIVH